MLSRSISTCSAFPIRIFSGIQPTGTAHLGNYLGAIKNWVKLQHVPLPASESVSLSSRHRSCPPVAPSDAACPSTPPSHSSSKLLYSIVDLHALTLPQDPAQLRKECFHMACVLLACGIDPKRSTLFIQSHVSGHSELAWLLSCLIPHSWMTGMIQFKEKSQLMKMKNIRFLSSLTRSSASSTSSSSSSSSSSLSSSSSTAASRANMWLPSPVSSSSSSSLCSATVSARASFSSSAPCSVPFEPSPSSMQHMTTAHNDTEKSKIKNEQNTSDDDLEEETETEKQDPELVSLGPSLGLFCYPVLQAADILLYRATHVPVGEDQRQHLALTADAARRFNRLFHTNFFPPPRRILGDVDRVMSLRDGTRKMSKSDVSENGRINLTDSPDTIATKIRRAKTDTPIGMTYDPVNRPEISNLLTIYAALCDLPIARVCEHFASFNHAQFKEKLVEVIVSTLDPIRTEIQRLERDPASVWSVLKQGQEEGNALAHDTLTQVKRHVGLCAP